MGLNYVGPLIQRFFSIVNTTVVHNQQLVESTDAEPRMKGNLGYGGLTINYMGTGDSLEGWCP